jgi:GMP synthase (glutamine-hydrolysing)
MRALAIRHVKFEDLGTWGPLLEARGWETEYLDAGVHSFADHDPRSADLLVVLGGPFGVYETETYPLIRDELAFVADRLAAGRPMIGVCFGAQLIAAVLGERVYPAKVKEIGFSPLTLTQTGKQSCLAAFAEDPITLHWHGDTFDLPHGAELLASTEHVPNQAFRVGSQTLAVQFHPEWGAQPLEPWLIGHSGELSQQRIDIPALRATAARLRPRLAAKAERILNAFLTTAGLARSDT